MLWLYKPSLESNSNSKALKLRALALNYQFYRSWRRPRAQRAVDSQQQTVTITTNYIKSYYIILYCAIPYYTMLYFTCPTCTILVLLRIDQCPRDLLLPPPLLAGTLILRRVLNCSKPLAVAHLVRQQDRRSWTDGEA